MDLLLRFKARNYDRKYHDDLELYTSRMIVSHSILCAVILPFVPLVQYYSYNEQADVSVIIRRTGLQYGVNLFLLFLSLFLRKYRSKLVKRQSTVRWLLDILYCLVEAYEAYFYSEGVRLRAGFQSYFWGWWNSLQAAIKINIISRWYMKAIAYLILIMTFGISSYIDQDNKAILVTLVQAVIFLGLQTYFQERTEKKHFLEKQKLFEETEALRDIIEQTSVSVMICGIEEGLLFKNSKKYEWWSDELSLEDNFSKVKLDTKGNAVNTLLLALSNGFLLSSNSKCRRRSLTAKSDPIYSLSLRVSRPNTAKIPEGRPLLV